MPYLIQRIVPPENLLIRPRVSYRVSELVFEFLNKKVLSLAGIMQSPHFTFNLVLSFNKGCPQDKAILNKSPYHRADMIYLSQKGFRVYNKVNKIAHLGAYGEKINENISPQDYALVVFEMFADYLLLNYKSIKKEILDQAWSQFNFLQLDQFPFPAPFEDQQYIMDKGKYMMEWNDYLTRQNDKWIVVKEEYKNRYGF
jgi:hypothetical protein